MRKLWASEKLADWREALERYEDIIERQGVGRLTEHDRWYRHDLPESIARRRTPHVTHTELVRLTEWKMARGVWRARNLVLVRGNPDETVVATSSAALAKIPHPTAPISTLAKLDGVGPATASAVAAATAPDVYPFFDEIVAAQVPRLGKVAFTLGYYARYADALRDRARELGKGWTPAAVEQALWSNAGGKAGSARD